MHTFYFHTIYDLQVCLLRKNSDIHEIQIPAIICVPIIVIACDNNALIVPFT